MEKQYDTCNKKCYPSRKIAKQVLKTIKKKHKDNTAQTVYFCEPCDSHHLTSLSKQNSRNLDNWKQKNLKI